MNARIFLGVKYHYKKIYHQLLDLGISDKQIVMVGKLSYEMGLRQYFDLPQLKHEKDETFVDAGVFDGLTSKQFVSWANGNYKHIYCFEPDKRNISKCHRELEYIESIGKLTIIPKGIWKQEGTLGFLPDRTGSGSSVGNGDEIISVTSIDHELMGKKVTFIKMDVEGAEYEGLQGAERIIRMQHPKLAIAVYHLSEDICRIPLLLMEYGKDYKFYIRHYSLFSDETILYAI